MPLSGRAFAILHDVRRRSDGTGLVFRSPRGKPLSNMTLSKLIKDSASPPCRMGSGRVSEATAVEGSDGTSDPSAPVHGTLRSQVASVMLFGNCLIPHSLHPKTRPNVLPLGISELDKAITSM